jgi:WD40 repeat protein
VATAVVALVAVVFAVPVSPWPGTTGAPGEPGGRPVLPERFGGLSPGTAGHRESPPGPVIALYHEGRQEPDGRDNSQQLVVGVDGRSYRQLDWVSPGTERPRNAVQGVLLSPDGSLVAVPGSLAPEDFAIIDLTTGKERYPDLSGEPLAWSPDGRRLAVELSGPAVDLDRPVVQVLDLANGAVTTIAVDNAAGTGHVPAAAAFSPDGRELAIHTRRESEPGGVVSIFDLAGNRQRVIPLSEQQALADGGTGWSPDGTLFVVIEASLDGPTSGLAFLDATGSGRRVPAPIQAGREDMVLLGWRSADTMLVGWDDGSSRGTNLIATVPLDGGSARTVSRFSVGEHGWVTGLQLATGLLADAEIHDAAGDPWHWQWRMAVAGLLVLVALATGWRLVRRRVLHP